MNKKVIISLPHLEHGGSERATSELANFFAGQNVETVVLLMYNRPKSYALHEKVKLIEPTNRWNKLPKTLYPFFLIFYLRFHIKNENPSSVLAFGYKTYIFIACLKLNIRLIDSLRTSPDRVRFPNNKFYNLIYNGLRKLLNQRIDGIIAQTNQAKNILAPKHKCQIDVIPNFIRTITNHRLERENIIISVGRLSPEKGHRYLLEAFARINADNWKLQLLGEGSEREKLNKLVEELGLEKSVIFEGFQPDVDYYLQKAKIFVLPSLIEGFPNALVEAMANGLACISFDCTSGPSEIIAHKENGILVEVKNVESLAFYLKDLIMNNEKIKQLGIRAKGVTKRYDKAVIGQEYLDFLIKEEKFADIVYKKGE